MNVDLIVESIKTLASLGLLSAGVGYFLKTRAETRQLRLTTFHKYAERYSQIMGDLVADGNFEREFPLNSPKDRKLSLELFFLFSEELYLAESEHLL